MPKRIGTITYEYTEEEYKEIEKQLDCAKWEMEYGSKEDALYHLAQLDKFIRGEDE